MADQKITELPIKKSSAMAATDYLLGIDSNEGYQMLIQDLGDYILRNTSLSDLATTSKNAFGAINETAQAATANTAGRIGMLSNVNLDDLHTDNTCGVYWLNNYSSDITGTKPVAEGQGLLIVKKQNSTTYRQTYIAVTGNTSPYFAVRSYSSSSWGEWQSASLQTILNTTYALGYNGMGRIQQNDDLNSYTTPGSYVATSTGITTTLSNCPITDSGFSLHVESVAGGTGQFIIQTIKRLKGGAQIYTRAYSGSVWTDWERINAGETEYTSLACSYGTLTYKCYKIGRIVSLIATIDVTTEVPKRGDIITGLPYTGQTSNYTPIVGFNNSNGEHPIFEIHRTNNNTDCALSANVVIASGTSIRINATYVTE